jgi:hypothetical protein
MDKLKPSPVYDVRAGSIRLAVWENFTDGKPWYNCTVSRRYRDGEEWKDANSFTGVADLAVVKQAVSLAIQWIADRERDLAKQAA